MSHLATFDIDVTRLVLTEKSDDEEGDGKATTDTMETAVTGDGPVHPQLMPQMIQPGTSMPAGMQAIVPTHVMPGKAS